MTKIGEIAVPNDVARGLNDENFKLRRSQWLGFGVLGVLVAVLVAMMFQNENKTVESMTELINSVDITNELLVVQSESLQFAASYERWLNGVTRGSNLKIRREELGVPLARFENHSATDSRQVSSEYLNALGVLDSFVDAAPPEVLTLEERIVQRANSNGVLETFIYESKAIVLFRSDGFDERTRQYIRDENTRRTNQNNVILVVLLLIMFANGTLAYSRFRDFRRIRVRLDDERHELEQTNVALKRVDSELQSRIDKERIERTQQQWVDVTTRSISLRFFSIIIPEKITAMVVEGLGRALRADTVIGFTFNESSMSGFVKQWSRRPETSFDESLIIKYVSDMSTLANRLWDDERVIIVSDSLQTDNSRDPIPEFAEVEQQRLRSWVIAPVGLGPQVLGLLFVAMEEDARVWSAAEIKLIENVASESANAYINLRIFHQTVEKAENDAKIGRMIELDKVKNDLIENMNHELRSPLTSIIGYVDLMIGEVDPGLEPDLAASLSVVQRNAHRLQDLIVNTMQLSKTEIQRVPLDISTVDIGNLLGDAFKSMNLDADNKGVELTLLLDPLPDKLLIDGDLSRLQQVFVNLLSNAIKYTPRGGTVTAIARRAHTDGDYVEVSVTDTGIGIPPEEFPSMFKRFFRASTATQASIPGFGIGLSLVHSIVTEHHGTITFDSAVGKGTVFTVTLPLRFIVVKPQTETM